MNAIPQAGLDFPAGGGARGPDISNMTPHEITDRLFNRIMELHEAGKMDSVQFLALNMAIPAFQLHDSLDAHLRFDLGRIGEVSGALDLARAQVDTLLKEHPDHLLGLVLAGNIARALNDAPSVAEYDRRLLAAEAAEMRKNLEEYDRHKVEIDSALAIARRGGR